MITRLLCMLAIGLALLLSAPLHAAWQSAVNGRMLGKRMPPLAPALLAAPPGAGHGVLLVDFWAPWCVPCRESVPVLNRLQHTYGARGLRVVGMAREPPAELAAFARLVPLDYPVGCDPGGTLFMALGVHSLPYAVLVDRNGIIVWQGNPSSLRAGTIETTLAAPAVGALVRF